MEDVSQSKESAQNISRRKFIKIGLAGAGGLAAAKLGLLALESRQGPELTEAQNIINQIQESDNTHWSYYEQKVDGLVDTLSKQPENARVGITVTSEDSSIFILRTKESKTTVTERTYNNDTRQFEETESTLEKIKDAIANSMSIGIETAGDVHAVSLSPDQTGNFWKHTNILLKQDIEGNPENMIERQVINQYLSAQEGVDFVLQSSERFTPEGFSATANDLHYSMRADGSNSTASQEDLANLMQIFDEDFQK